MTAPKLTAAQRQEMRDKRAKDAAKVKLLVGRTIVKAEPNGSWEGEGMNGVWMHDWALTLDDGAEIVFMTEEHPDAGEYGVQLIRRAPLKETERSHPSARYILRCDDGEAHTLTLPEVLANCRDRNLLPSDVSTIRSLAPGDTFEGGTGRVEWSVTRMENS